MKSVFLALTLLLMVGTPPRASADVSYDSNASVGFVGKYTPPDTGTSNDGSTDQGNSNGDNSNQSSDNGSNQGANQGPDIIGDDSDDSASTAHVLPKTGETPNHLVSLGALVMSLAIIILYQKKKTQKRKLS